jgi:hypothetical protein
MHFGITRGYTTRWPVQAHDPFKADPSYQQAVYAEASVQLRMLGPQAVVMDYGCGSGAKSLQHLPIERLIGVEVPEVQERLASRYPDGLWLRSDSALVWSAKVDMILCADVLEHVADPELLLRRFRAMKPQKVMLSTPARERIKGGSLTGPPTNPCHAREWTMPEFLLFCEQFFVTQGHWLIDPKQATQCYIGTPR